MKDAKRHSKSDDIASLCRNTVLIRDEHGYGTAGPKLPAGNLIPGIH